MASDVIGLSGRGSGKGIFGSACHAVETIFSPVPGETINSILKLNAWKESRAYLRLLLL